MTSFETVAIIVLIILAIAIAITKSFKNYNDGNEANDEEIKGYVFDGIRDVMDTIEVISGRTVEDTKKYVIEETTKKLTTLREESGIKFNLSEGTLTELITAVIDNNFGNDIDQYVKACEICGQEDCTCDDVEEDTACENTSTVEPETDIIEEAPVSEPEDIPEEDEPINEEAFDTLKDEEGNEVDVPAGNLDDEPEEIDYEGAEEETTEEVVEPVEESTEEAPVEEVIEEAPVEEAVETTEEVVEEAPVEEVIEEAPVEEAVETTEEVVEPVEESTEETDVHTTESCTCIECMTKPQIKAWAADHDIFVSSKMLKADMIEKVKTEFEAKASNK